MPSDAESFIAEFRRAVAAIQESIVTLQYLQVAVAAGYDPAAIRSLAPQLRLLSKSFERAAEIIETRLP